MANKIYSTEVIQLQDWEGDIEIRPLTIKNLRKVYEKINALTSDDKKNESVTMLDIMLEAVAIAMQQFEPKLADPDTLSDHVDMPTLEHILDAAAGIRLNDPNLTKASAAAGMMG